MKEESENGKDTINYQRSCCDISQDITFQESFVCLFAVIFLFNDILSRSVSDSDGWKIRFRISLSRMFRTA